MVVGVSDILLNLYGRLDTVSINACSHNILWRSAGYAFAGLDDPLPFTLSQTPWVRRRAYWRCFFKQQLAKISIWEEEGQKEWASQSAGVNIHPLISLGLYLDKRLNILHKGFWTPNTGRPTETQSNKRFGIPPSPCRRSINTP